MARRTSFALPSTTAVSNRFSAGGSSAANLGNTTTGTPGASGVGTANTLATLLTVSGAGYVPFLVCYSNSATPAHTIRCQVIIDGTIVFDATSDTITTTVNKGICIVDSVPNTGSGATPSGYPLRFNSSLVVKAASSQSGTDFVAVRYEYQRTAY
jgi:hypothetical protein